MKKRTRYVLLFLAVCSLVAAVLPFARFSHRALLATGEELPLTPSFFYHKSPGSPVYRTVLYSLGEGGLTRQKGQELGYRSFYSEDARQSLLELGYGEDCGQLLFQDEYPIGTVFLFDTAPEKGAHWSVFLQNGCQVQAYEVPKADIFDSLTDYSVSPTHLYLHRHTNQGEIVITSLELSTGKQQSQSVSLASLGLEGALVDSSNAYDPRCNRLLLFYSQGNGRFLGSYDFKDGTFAALPLTRPVSHVLATDSGYLMANTSSHRQVILYAYDLAWNPQDQYTISLAIDKEWSGPAKDLEDRNALALVDGVLYGCVNGEKRTYWYGARLEDGQVLALHEIKPAHGFDLSAIKLYDGSGKQPYPTLF